MLDKGEVMFSSIIYYSLDKRIKMKLFLRIIFKIFLILTILIGSAAAEEIKETDPATLLDRGIEFAKKGQYDRAINYFNKALDKNPRFAEAYHNRISNRISQVLKSLP